MAFFQKTVTLTYETPSYTTGNAKAVRLTADAYIRTALTKLSPLATILKVTYVTTLAGAVTIRNKSHQTYDIKYTFDVEAPATDLAQQIISSALVLPSRRNKTDVFALLDRKVV